MKLERIEVRTLALPLRVPFETSVGRMTAEEDIVDPPVVVSRDGMIAVPEAPGIGQDIVWPRVERATLFKETWTRS